MNDQTVEQEIQAKGLTAPRVTPDDIDAAIGDSIELCLNILDGKEDVIAMKGE